VVLIPLQPINTRQIIACFIVDLRLAKVRLAARATSGLRHPLYAAPAMHRLITMAEAFQLDAGGPVWRWERAAHLDSLRRLVPVVVAVTWLPMMALAALAALTGRAPEPLIRDLSVHARLLVALPLLVVANRFLGETAAMVVARLFDEGFLPGQAGVRARVMLGRVARWRDSPLPDAFLLALALFVGVAALLGWIAPAGHLHGVSESPVGPVRVWYALVGLPLFQLFLWRSLFRWLLWLRVLIGLSGLPLRLLPGHADRHAGIGFVKIPTLVYGAVILFAVSSILCAGWATQAVLYGKALDALKPLFFAFVVIGTLVAYGPLLRFTPKLLLTRGAARRRYGALVADYTERFERRWVDTADHPDPLGSQDMQAFNDLSSSYRSNIEEMRVMMFDPRDWLVLLLAAALPALPLLFVQAPAQEVVQRLIKLLVGGLPK
jgi:hypothetical protein